MYDNKDKREINLYDGDYFIYYDVYLYFYYVFIYVFSYLLYIY